MDGQAFAWTPAGPVPIEQDGTPLGGNEVHAGSVESIETVEPHDGPAPVIRRALSGMLPQGQARPQPAPLVLTAPPAKTVGPINVVRLARARAKEIRAELRRMKRLADELTELDRLIAAAKQKPLAAVRNLDSARQVR